VRFFFLVHTKVRILNKKALFYHFSHKKIWNFQGEDLSLQRVFHSIRFKVNKVGIQWYPIFFAPLLLEGDKISVFMKFHTSFPIFSVWFHTPSVFAPFHPTTHSHFPSLPSIIL